MLGEVGLVRPGDAATASLFMWLLLCVFGDVVGGV